MCHDSKSHILFNENFIWNRTHWWVLEDVFFKVIFSSFLSYVCFGRGLVYFQTLEKTLQPAVSWVILRYSQWKWFEKWKISWKSSRCYPVVVDVCWGERMDGLYPKNPISPLKIVWNAKCPIFSGNFTPKTSNYCLEIGHRQLSRRRYFEEPPETMKEGPTGDS